MHKIIDTIISTILLSGAVFVIDDIKDIARRESISRFLLNGLLFSICGIILNILFNIIIK